ncbi:MAG: PIN domain-containing protein [Acidobacteriota bacterium]
MTAILVDTDVYSYITSSNPKRGIPYKRHLDGHSLALSFITVGEQYAGYLKAIAKKKWPEMRLQKLEAELRNVAIVPYDIEVCKVYGDIKATVEANGVTVQPNDLWIAACAKRHSLTLVTNNRKHFAPIPGLTIISEAPGS